jgi:hypothetical protein
LKKEEKFELREFGILLDGANNCDYFLICLKKKKKEKKKD